MATTLPTIPQARHAIFDARAFILAAISVLLLWVVPVSNLSLFLANIYAAFLLLYIGVPGRWVVTRLGLLLASLLPFLILVPFVNPAGVTLYEYRGLQLSDTGSLLAIGIFLKANLALAWVLGLLASYNLPQGLYAARQLGLPPRLAGLVFLSHRQIGLLYIELSQIRLAVRLRGYRPQTSRHGLETISQLIGSLFSRSFQRGDQLYHALRLRGFQGQMTLLEVPAFQKRDFMLIAISAGVHGLLAGAGLVI
jgi:cobalt/nickel transport system permease protein